MLTEFSLDPPEPLPRKVNVFFVVLALGVAITGCYSALQFTETLLMTTMKKTTSQRKASVALMVLASAFSIAVNAVFLMHFLSMSAIEHGGKPVRYGLGGTVLSIFFIFGGSLIGYLVWTFHKGGLFGDHERSALMQAYYSRPDDKAPWRDHLDHSLRLIKLALGPRLVVAGSFLAVGVLAMHYFGMQSMRSQMKVYYNPVMIGMEVLIGPVAGSAAVLLLFTSVGLRRRILGSIVLGIAITLVHWYGYFSGTYCALKPGEHMAMTEGEVVVDAEVLCVSLILLSSVIRFGFMGIVAKT